MGFMAGRTEDIQSAALDGFCYGWDQSRVSFPCVIILKKMAGIPEKGGHPNAEHIKVASTVDKVTANIYPL